MPGSLLRVWLVVAGVAIGAVIAGDGSPGAEPSICVALAGALGCAVRRRLSVVLVALFVFGLGCGALAASTRARPQAGLVRLAETIPACDLRGRVLERLGGGQTLLSVEVADCGEGHESAAGTVAAEVTAPPGSPYAAKGWLIPLSERGFDLYRRRAGAAAELVPDDLAFGRPRGAFHIAELVRRGLRQATAAIPAREGALVRGLTIGDTDGIGVATLEAFRRSGLSHLLAVSGSNVALVLAGAGWLFRRLSFKLRMGACVTAIALFVLVVGPDASVLRAAAMGAIGLFALALGRQTEPLHALGLAVAVVIVVRPQIVFSIGLHLSVAATAGIVLWTSRVEVILRRLPGVIRLPLAVTASAQVAVLPVLVAGFGQASVVAPLANLLAAAAVVPATALGLVGGAVGVVSPALGGLILRTAQPFAAWILGVAEICARPSWASVSVDPSLAWLLAGPVVAVALWSIRSHGGPINLPP